MSGKPDKKAQARSLTVIEGGKPGTLVTAESARMTQAQVDLLKRTMCPDLLDDEVSLYVHYCQSSGADPLKKEAWAQVRFAKAKDKYGGDKVDGSGKQVYERRLVMGLSKHQVQKRLEDRPDFAGIQSAVVYEKDTFEADLGTGFIKHVVKSLMKKDRGMMIAAWCRISRRGKEPYVRILDIAERRQDTGSYNWKSMPETMLLKCVEMDAVRACYPKEFANVYDESEADTFGERIPVQDLQETSATVNTTVKEIETFAAELPTVPATPAVHPIDVEAPSRGGAFVSADQMNGLKAVMQEFQLDAAQLGALVEKVIKRKVKAMADLVKPDFQKLAKVFEGVRDGTYTLSGGKLLTPEDIEAFKKPKDGDEIPF